MSLQWAEALGVFQQAADWIGLESRKSLWGQFWSAHQRFFKYLCVAAKVHRLVELAQDKGSYFGNLVQDYKVYSLEMMSQQTSSTEMLQEIRTMMTQLKSYLLQSTELKALVDPTLHTEEELGRSRAGLGSGRGPGMIPDSPPFP